MAHGLKFWYEWRSETDNALHRVEILEQDYVGGDTEVSPAADPFVVEYPNFEITDPVRGNGARLSFYFEGTEAEIRDFFTVDIKKFRVDHYIDSSLNWCGYLNSEIYNEDYSADFGTLGALIELSANNGFGIMERMKFVNIVTEEEVRDVLSIGEYVQKCITDLDLPYVNLYVAIGTTFVNHLSASVSALTEVYVNSSNYTDEDGEISSIREVLESVLQPFGAGIIEYGSELYITDTHTLHGNDSVTFKHYTIADMVYQGDVVVPITVDINDIGYYRTGQSVEYRTGISKQSVSFDPYVGNTLLNCRINEGSLFGGYTNQTHKGIDQRRWVEFNYTTHANIDFLTSAASPKKIHSYPGHPESPDKASYCIAVTPSNNANGAYADLAFVTKLNAPHLTDTDLTWPAFDHQGRVAYILMEHYIRTTDEYDWPDMSREIWFVETRWVLKMGDWYMTDNFQSGNNTWSLTPSTFPIILTVDKNGQINDNYVIDKWKEHQGLRGVTGSNRVDTAYDFNLFPYDDTKHADLTLGMTPFVQTWTYNEQSASWSEQNAGHLIKDIWIRDLEVSSYVDGLKKQDSEDLVSEFTGFIDSRYKDDGGEIKTTIGSMSSSIYGQRGVMLMDHAADTGMYEPVLNTSTSRGGNTDNIENLLIATIIGNYETPAPIISANLKKISPLAIIKNPPTFDGKKFMFTGGSINYRNNNVDASWVEIRADKTI